MKLLIYLLFPLFLSASPIVIVTMAIGDSYKELVKTGIENKRLYAEKQGYDFVFSDENLDLSRPVPWSKILLLLKVMEKSDAEWLFWSDADSLIMNSSYRLEEFIDEKYDMIAARDPNAPINTGQFFIRNCEWSRELLKKVYERKECIHHPWWENQAFILEMGDNSDLIRHLKIVPQRLFNSYPYEGLSVQYQSGDFILHFAGIHGQLLEQYFAEYINCTIDTPTTLNLEKYLGYYGVALLEREKNSRPFIDELRKIPPVSKVAALGLDKGFLPEVILENTPDFEKITIFQGPLKESPPGEYFKRKYKERAHFFAAFCDGEGERFDLIVIEKADRQSLLDAQVLADSHTLIWVNPYKGENRGIVNSLIREGKLELVSKHDRKGREWVQLRYL